FRSLVCRSGDQARTGGRLPAHPLVGPGPDWLGRGAPGPRKRRRNQGAIEEGCDVHLAAYDRLRPYKGRVIPNFLARDRENARAVYEASRRTALIGVMTAHFDSVAACIDQVRALLEELPAVSVGLGDGQPQQW